MIHYDKSKTIIHETVLDGRRLALLILATLLIIFTAGSPVFQVYAAAQKHYPASPVPRSGKYSAPAAESLQLHWNDGSPCSVFLNGKLKQRDVTRGGW